MVWVVDSRTPGYLGPLTTPSPLQDDPWIDFLQAMVAGITGLDGTLVRPRWQETPPAEPEINIDWAAVGITNTTPNWCPAIVHDPAVDGHDILQNHEVVTLFCSFYGPRNQYFATLLNNGLFIDQNRAELRRNGIGLVEVTPFVRAPELFRQQFRGRIDTNVILRREVRYHYPVLNLLRGQGTIETDGEAQSAWDTNSV